MPTDQHSIKGGNTACNIVAQDKMSEVQPSALVCMEWQLQLELCMLCAP